MSHWVPAHSLATTSRADSQRKSGTWLRAFFENLMPKHGINLMKSAPKHNEALKALGLVDKIVNEPLGGAHRDAPAAAQALKKALAEALRQLQGKKPKELVEERLERLMDHGKFKDLAERS